MNVRNVAIIAHVDHGKTTLVDAFLRQTGVFRENQQVVERVMDSHDLERERGITILAKNTAVLYQDTKINIVDTPGHADFGGEVERILSMVDGVLLVVDAVEGPMPQTRFVLQKALSQGLTPLVVINKVDRPFGDPARCVDEVLDLFIGLSAEEDQLDFPVYYCSAVSGVASKSLTDVLEKKGSILPLLDGIIQKIPAPIVEEGPLRMMVSTLDYDEYVGRIGIGRIRGGTLKQAQEVLVSHSHHPKTYKGKIAKLYTFSGLGRIEVQETYAGDIVAFCGISDVKIGETLNEPLTPKPLPAITVDEPTLAMVFRVNDGPLAGQEGKYVTSRHIRDRLLREVRTNVALRVEETASPDSFSVAGRGELHLSVLIETMRREGYEFCVSKPLPVLREGQEPYENLVIDVPEEYLGPVMESLGQKKAEMVDMRHVGDSRVKVSFVIPARGLIGFSSPFLTETKGYGIMYHTFSHYGPWKGDIPARQNGSLVAWEAGVSTGYALSSVEQRGVLFLGPNVLVYPGMVVGENHRKEDLEVNVAKKKQLTNMRASSSDDLIKLAPPRKFSLEQAIAYLAEDEYLEITPKNLRMRKSILDRHQRERLRKKKESNYASN